MKQYIIFSANYLPNLGGVERYTYNLSKKLVKKGYGVVVVTSNVDKFASYEEQENIKIYRIPCINLLDGRFPVLKLNFEFFELLKEISKTKYDLCIVNTRFYVHSLFGVLFGRKHSKKTIVIEHGTNHFTINNRFWDFLGHIYEHTITFFIKFLCKEYYGVSLACNKWLSHYKIKAVSTLHNAIDIDHINYLLKNSEVNYIDEYQLPKDSIMVTYTGRLVKEKGILKLIETINEINKINKNIYLFIAGDGDLFDKINRNENSNIKVLGKLNFNQVISLLKQTDIFCLPTDYPEGFPTSVIEAAACKCFVITTDSGGSKELIINDDYGIILKENSVKEIIDSINYVVNNHGYKERAKQLSYDRCIENFVWDIVANKVEKM